MRNTCRAPDAESESPNFKVTTTAAPEQRRTMESVHAIDASIKSRTPLQARYLNRKGNWLSFRRTLSANGAYARAAPNSAPTPAVTAIARAPHTTTRSEALTTGAPPAFAASAPSTAKKISDIAPTLAAV